MSQLLTPTLKATAINSGVAFMTDANIDAVNVYSAGGTINNNDTAITISNGLLAPTGQGVSGTSIAVAAGGSGYAGAPLVKLTGGTGTGATGYAVVTGGVVTSVVVTSPGIGYTAGDTLTARDELRGMVGDPALVLRDVVVDARMLRRQTDLVGTRVGRDHARAHVVIGRRWAWSWKPRSGPT